MKRYEQKAMTVIIFIFIMAVSIRWCHNYAVDHFSSPSSEAAASDKSAARFYTVTAYCPCEICCGKWADGHTASGVLARGKIVAAPPGMPFGTVLEIPGYGRCRVQDRGGAIKGNRLDVLFATHQEALNWGVQELMVREVR